MTEIDTRVLIEKLAPLDGTAASLAKQLATQAFVAQCRLAAHPAFEVPRGDPRQEALIADYLRCVDYAVSTFTAAFLARALVDVDPGRAEDVSAVVVDLLEDGEPAMILASGWLDRDGVDREEIVRAVQAERTEATA